jgi:hypothetical protein
LSSNEPFEFLNTGQTGVERGVFLTAEALGIEVHGFMAANGRDELGRVPEWVAARLRRCRARGPRRCREANVQLADAVVVMVPNARRAAAVTGMKHVMTCARSRRVPLFVCDRHCDIGALADSVIAALRARRGKAIYITGPRATRWSEGEELGRSLARAIAVAAALEPFPESPAVAPSGTRSGYHAIWIAKRS